MFTCGAATPDPSRPTPANASVPSHLLCASMHLFEAGRYAPAAGLHDAVVAAHVLADLPVLLAPLLPAGQDRRVAEERRDTVTGQSADSKGGGGGEGGRERQSEALAAQASQQREAQ